jgi:hypothetical protein
MKKKVLVEKKNFDDALHRILQSKPIPKSKVKTSGKNGPKTPILAKP